MRALLSHQTMAALVLTGLRETLVRPQDVADFRPTNREWRDAFAGGAAAVQIAETACGATRETTGDNGKEELKSRRVVRALAALFVVFAIVGGGVIPDLLGMMAAGPRH
jgi:hypothetical protein